MDTLRVGLVGFGYAGATIHAPLIRATPGLALAAVASRDAAKVQAALGPAVAVTTPEALVAQPDLDLVVIAAPNDRHHPLARAALAGGRHVVIDKPFALDAREAAELVALAAQRRRVLSVFHNRRWDGDFRTVAQALRDGLIGRPVEFTAHFDRFRPQVRARWREGAGPGAGIWLDLGPHLVDQALQLFGEPAAITLDLRRLRDGALADDGFTATLRWADDGPWRGLRAHLAASMLAAHPGPRFVLHGSAGSLRIDGLDGQEDALKAGATAAQIAAPGWGREGDPVRAGRLWRDPGDGTPVETTLPLQPGVWPAYYAGVRDAIRGTGPNPVTPDSALAVQRWLDAGFASARERREVAAPAA